VAITEVFVADGAADEQMAGQLMHPSAAEDGLDPRWVKTLPNLQLVVMDRAHASRRLLQRTWDKDEYFNSILHPLIWDKHSLVRTLQYSDVAKELFRGIVLGATPEDQRPAFNLGFAPQRFDSCAKPLARLLDHFDAAVAAAAELIRRRPALDAPACGAARGLRVLSSEAVLQLGMLADCAEVALRLTRFLDTESYDKALLPAKLRSFRQECHHLFVEGGCFTWEGRTRHVVQNLLCRRRLVFPRPHEPLTIGDDTSPVSETIRQRCLARMVNWWRLAQAVLEADFPQHDLLCTFAAFELSPSTSGAGGAAVLSTDEREALDTWADRLSLDPGALREQFLQLRALAILFRPRCSNTLEAWQQAILETQATAARRVAHPVDALLPVVRRFAAYTGSTSGVESDFSRFKRALGEHRHFGPDAEERIAVLSSRCPSNPEEDMTLARSARMVWAQCFGAPRGPRRKGLPQHGRRCPQSESEVAKARARQMDLAAAIAEGRRATPPWPQAPSGKLPGRGVHCRSGSLGRGGRSCTSGAWRPSSRARAHLETATRPS
jgi:hypothetical protein